jgi:cysteine desulfurase
MKTPIYLDYNATTPLAPEVAEATVAALRDTWGNPSSAHAYGKRARRAVDASRESVAALIECRPDEVIFTGGGTETDNAAVIGVAEALRERGRHIVISAVEHAAVERACGHLEERGWQVSRIGVDANGVVDVDALAAALRRETVLVSVMHAQNETGVLQPVARIAALARTNGSVFHTDTAQSVGKLPVRADELGADLLTIAGHKLYGPKGVGALFLRRDTPFTPLLRGAAHEAGRRAGTENVPAIVGLGAACELAATELSSRERHLRELRDRLEAGLRSHVPDLVVHGAAVMRLPNTLSVALPGADATTLLGRVEGVAAAAGAACHSGRAHVSGVLRAMGVDDALALCTLRLTVGRPTRAEDVERAADLLGAEAARLRRAA